MPWCGYERFFVARVELNDDGLYGDEKAGDGIFTARVALAERGLYQMRVVSSIETSAGIALRESLESVYRR